MKKLFLVVFLGTIFITRIASAMAPIPEIPPVPEMISNGNTYHIDKDIGDDSLNDGSLASPWATIQYGIDQLTAGDTLIIHEGATPYQENPTGYLPIYAEGDPDNWITIKGAEGENVIITGERIVFVWEPSKYLLLKNLVLRGSGYSVLDLRANTSNIVIEDVEIDGLSSSENSVGVNVVEGAHDIWFKNMDIHHCGYARANPNTAGGVNIAPSTTTPRGNFIFMNVTVHDCKGDGFSGRQGLDSVYVEGSKALRNTGDGFDLGSDLDDSYKKELIFKNCISAENGGDQGNGYKIWSKNSWLVNSIAYDNAYAAVSYKPLSDNSNFYMINNTLKGDDAVTYASVMVNPVGSSYGTNDVYMYNNIIHAPNVKAIVFEDHIKSNIAGEDNNYYFSDTDGPVLQIRDQNDVHHVIASYTATQMGDGTWYNATGFGEHNIGKVKTAEQLNPGFVDPENADYHLQADSDAVDGGTDLGLLADYEGTPVPQGAAPDIGAYEFKQIWPVEYVFQYSWYSRRRHRYTYIYRLALQNNSNQDVQDIRCTIQSHPDSIWVRDGIVSFQDLPAHSIETSGDSFKIRTAEPLTDLSGVEWLIEYNDANGNYVSSIISK